MTETDPMRVLLTGTAGFIGSHFVRYLVERHPDWELVTLQRRNYMGGRLAAYRDKVKVHRHDVRDEVGDYLATQIGEVDLIIHLAAETDVAASLVRPRQFVETNVMGTLNLLEYARQYQARLKMFFYVSTDEVYGPAAAGTDHAESAPHRPSTPYSGAKAAAEDLCSAWERSMGLPVIVTNTMHNIGEMQPVEKFIPTVIRAIRDDGIVTVHGSRDLPSSRKYLYAGDYADAIDHLGTRGRSGERYNVVGEELSNLELVMRIEKLMGKKAKIRFVGCDSVRPGYDLRYSLDGSKMAALGWEPPTPIDTALEKVVSWTLENPAWL